MCPEENTPLGFGYCRIFPDIPDCQKPEDERGLRLGVDWAHHRIAWGSQTSFQKIVPARLQMVRNSHVDLPETTTLFPWPDPQVDQDRRLLSETSHLSPANRCEVACLPSYEHRHRGQRWLTPCFLGAESRQPGSLPPTCLFLHICK